MALRNLALAVFFGGGLAVLFGTRALFAAADSRKQGGHFSGALLRSFEILRVAALVALAIASVLSRGYAVHTAIFGGLVAGGVLVDRRLRALRAEIGGSTEALDPADPRRRRFGSLHGVSVIL
ncbi:MAG: hypothetical protein ACXWLM_05940, partial [Myxococcales bacterium]